MESLEGKVYAFTGGAGGIGLATAKIIATRGATERLADIETDAMRDAEAYFREQETPFSVTKVDVSNKDEFGRLDGAANVAGAIGKHHGIRAVADLEDEEWHKIIAVNLTGCMYCLRAELRNIADGGSIVNAASIHGIRGFAKHDAYDASKHGVIGLTRAAANDNDSREVRVNDVAPGAIYTPLMEKFHNHPLDAAFDEPTAFQRQGTAEECGNVIAFLLSPESSFMSGSIYQVDGAWL
ncbi:LOW QUALITY PROTEIN: short chain dehydrogenase [Colletotrichum navitas]|uniref:Short chain dehydrogenase n=1 Tax=Colletotrichum navitas TaxID=681940 RepID=A0AAD8V655_9PEZI|nr:LOW QUALITY PROTEIN: short chain dehydrogenase [Colletotrichum navitas]KAK1594048.1 LOW QUALITY PROTEIN: short chain dehydrogenase [Colletotrichum navitas]